MSVRKTRVLVVDDSLTIRKFLVATLSAAPDMEVVGEAVDGRRAIELCESLRPDVVTLDMMLPVMSGLSATEYIMAYCPTPILIVSASTNRGEVFKTYDALSAGAVDVFEKPRGGELRDEWERQFLAKVRLVSKIRVITHPRGRLTGGLKHPPAAPAPAEAPSQVSGYRCVAIGASTGGPAAVLEVLTGLPEDFPLPILLVIHIGEPFGFALCEWLDGLSPIRVSIPSDGDPLPPVGKPGVIMAPHRQHLIVRRGRLGLNDGPERHSCRPSVDVLFESVAHEVGAGALGCLLTGMGRDGAAGLLAIKQAGGTTLAQDEATSVVFGMPREAIGLGAANRVLPLDGFAPALRTLAAAQSTGRGG